MCFECDAFCITENVTINFNCTQLKVVKGKISIEFRPVKQCLQEGVLFKMNDLIGLLYTL